MYVTLTSYVLINYVHTSNGKAIFRQKVGLFVTRFADFNVLSFSVSYVVHRPKYCQALSLNLK